MNQNQEAEKKCMKDGTIQIDEAQSFQNLSLDELYMLYNIYRIRLNKIKRALRKLQRKDSTSDIAKDIMKRHQHYSPILDLDVELIIKGFDGDTNWSYYNRKVSNETLALSAVCVLYDKYNIHIDKEKYINEYDIKQAQFYYLHMKLKEWCDLYYWK
jgi:hypothetical protein